MVRLDEVAVGYNRKVIIDGIELEIEAGEVVTLIGPNGSGKSTILKSVIGQLPLVAGKTYIADKAVKDMSASEMARLTSVVMTDRVRTELMTCREVVANGRYPYTNKMGVLSKEDWNKVDAAIARVHAEDIAGCDFMKTSDGLRQRIMLARALCQEPKLMVLDEPTSYLDIKHKLSMIRLIRELAKDEGIAILMSLHELELARIVSDRIVCLKNGHIDKIGTSEEVFADNYIKELFDIEEEDYKIWQGL